MHDPGPTLTPPFLAHASEITLLVFGLLLVVGLVGEYSEASRWKTYVRWFPIMVIVGVAGELLADGAIFVFSERLQTIEVAEVNDKALSLMGQLYPDFPMPGSYGAFVNRAMLRKVTDRLDGLERGLEDTLRRVEKISQERSHRGGQAR